MAKDKQSVVTVEVKRTKKLTLQEINALVDVTIQKINESVDKYNKTIWEIPKYKAAVKAIKTKHKLLKAEKELVRLKQEFPNVSFNLIYSLIHHLMILEILKINLFFHKQMELNQYLN